MFDVKTKSRHFMRASRNYTSALRPKRISQTLLGETAVNFWRFGLRHVDMLEHSNYQTARCPLSFHLPQTNDMNNIPRFQRFEVVYGLDIAARGRCLILRLQHKSVELVMDLVAKFSGQETWLWTFVGRP